MTARAVHREGSAYLAITAAIVAFGWAAYGWQAGVMAACATVPAFFGVLFATRRETRDLRAALDAADDELDDYDALRALVGVLVDAAPRSTVERAAARGVRAAWPQFVEAADTEPEDVAAA